LTDEKEKPDQGAGDPLADPGGDPTTVHVRRVLRGDKDSLDWLVARFSPVLLCHARWCLGAKLCRLLDPEDLVQGTWAVALPKLPRIVPRSGRSTPALVRFLSTTLVHLANRWIKKHIVRRREGQSTPPDGQFDSLAAETSEVITSVVRRERQSHLARSIEQLTETDRTILILRGLEEKLPSWSVSLRTPSISASPGRYEGSENCSRIRCSRTSIPSSSPA
jgi:DNA-directed RNA polymerase specialized sigma24 family protein